MRTRSVRRIATVLAFAAMLPILAVEGRAAPPVFEVPVDCDIGRDCFVQLYVDRGAGPEVADYRCGALSYDGHNGADIRLADLPAMRRGVAVRAAAGTVRAVRDGEGDHGLCKNAQNIAGREAGNGLVISHDEGWET